MSKNIRFERKVFEEHVITDTGKIVSAKTVYNIKTEPEYVKLYINCVLTLNGLRKGLSNIFLAFLPYMSYADANSEDGGQVIFINKAMKNIIAKKLNIGLESINKAVSEFTKTGLFKRLSVGMYQINPNIVGRGEWKDIKNIRATFDFASKEIVADIIKNEEAESDEQKKAI